MQVCFYLLIFTSGVNIKYHNICIWSYLYEVNEITIGRRHPLEWGCITLLDCFLLAVVFLYHRVIESQLLLVFKNRKTWSHENASVFEAKGRTGQRWQSSSKEYHVFYLNFYHLNERNLSLMEDRGGSKDMELFCFCVQANYIQVP